MPVKTNKPQKAHSQTEFMEYFRKHVKNHKNGIKEDGIDVKEWTMSVYWQYQGRCMGCGCPKNHVNMNESISPYYCTKCMKNELSKEIYNKQKQKIDKIVDDTRGMDSHQLLNYIKKMLSNIANKGKDETLHERKREFYKNEVPF